MFPYTLDYGHHEMCVVEPCPKDRYPGLWEVPMNSLFKSRAEPAMPPIMFLNKALLIRVLMVDMTR